ncbi:hypothetical protein [Providencia stuartii]|uniref:hypothetical protein n=1 Tax=Providencia stuartii TaxID=588 RepID=UPI00090067FC|nr:hypothetical protein [Providencia stuartii]AMG66666.2 hypothetical protein AL507_08760 [Providencia stuartii]
MKDRIKFNDAMLAAVMDGRKTQTRRPMKVQPVLNGNWWEVYGAGWGKDSKSMPAVPGHSLANNCPYGKVGDIINIADEDGTIKGRIEITDVWLQQLRDITLGDICKEIGCGLYDFIPATYGFQVWEDTWRSIYGEESWNNNPWVWVIEFRRID